MLYIRAYVPPKRPDITGEPATDLHNLIKRIDDSERTLKLWLDSLNNEGALAISTGTTWTPTITSGAGTFTTVSGSGFYRRIGEVYWYYLTVTITTKGTATGAVRVTLPSTPVFDNVGHGRCVGLSGFAVTATGAAAANYVDIVDYASVSVIADTEVIRVMGWYI